MLALPDIDKLVIDSPELGCVLYLPGLPGGSNKIHDRSPYCNTGTITGATWKRLPSGLWVLWFDGTDDVVNCGSHASLDISSAYTIKAWIYSEDVTVNASIVCKNDAEAVQPFLLYHRNTAQLRYFASADGVAWGTQITTTNTISADTWYHIVVTHDGSTTKMFVNVAEWGSDTSPDDPQTGTGDSVFWGKRGTQLLQGYIALPEIHNRAWSLLEVHKSFNREKHLFGVW